MTTVTTEGIQSANQRLKAVIREATLRLDQAQFLSVNAALLIRYGCWAAAVACCIAAALAGAVVSFIVLLVALGAFLGGQRLVKMARTSHSSERQYSPPIATCSTAWQGLHRRKTPKTTYLCRAFHWGVRRA